MHEREFNPFPTPDAATAALGAQLGQLRRELARVQQAYANLVAACQAALTARHDGEPDPWWFIEDELPPTPPGHPLNTDSDSRRGGGGR
ncbi:hypothetical protein [Phytohabitans houttuyneae]|uniref:hypothetical protein n=1 Tax=Phytohabitans houttuyneae TaxID=1076126 RepID=UPI0015674881|nr:hypothetical protein [Phytohabitans houttuyneae]